MVVPYPALGDSKFTGDREKILKVWGLVWTRRDVDEKMEGGME